MLPLSDVAPLLRTLGLALLAVAQYPAPLQHAEGDVLGFRAKCSHLALSRIQWRVLVFLSLTAATLSLRTSLSQAAIHSGRTTSFLSVMCLERGVASKTPKHLATHRTLHWHFRTRPARAESPSLRLLHAVCPLEGLFRPDKLAAATRLSEVHLQTTQQLLSTLFPQDLQTRPQQCEMFGGSTRKAVGG